MVYFKPFHMDAGPLSHLFADILMADQVSYFLG